MSTKMIKRRMLTILAVAALTSSCGFAAMHQAAQGAGVTHPVKALEVLHPDLLALLTDEEIQTVESVMNRQTGKRRINISSMFAHNILPETKSKPPYPINVENIQDCDKCPKLAVIPAGSFDRKPILLPGVTYTWSYLLSCSDSSFDDNLAKETFKFCSDDYLKSRDISRDKSGNYPGFECTEYINHPHGVRECSRRRSEKFPKNHFIPMTSEVININKFAIGISEVNINQFRQFVKETNWDSKWNCNVNFYNNHVKIGSRMVNWDQYSSSSISIRGPENFEQLIWENAPRGDEPVRCVGYDDAVAYTRWLSEKTGQTYRLPSLLEWQYAARAGAETPFWWGWRMVEGRDDFAYDERLPAIQGWPSPYGLYGMYGRTTEWTADCVLNVDPKTLRTLQPYLSGDTPGFKTHSVFNKPDHLWVYLLRSDFPPSIADHWPGGYWRKDGKARTEPSDCLYRSTSGKTYFSTTGWQSWHAAPVFRAPDDPKPTNGFRVARDLN